MGGQEVALHKVVILLLLPKASLLKTFASIFSLMDYVDHLHVILQRREVFTGSSRLQFQDCPCSLQGER